jgi:hypothetical protein
VAKNLKLKILYMIIHQFTMITGGLTAINVRRASKEKRIWSVIYEVMIIRENLSAKFVERVSIRKNI